MAQITCGQIKAAATMTHTVDDLRIVHRTVTGRIAALAVFADTVECVCDTHHVAWLAGGGQRLHCLVETGTYYVARGHWKECKKIRCNTLLLDGACWKKEATKLKI